MYITQKHIENITRYIKKGKVVIIYGARRVGKTTLLKKYVETLPENERVLFVNGNDIVVREFLESQSVNKLKDFVGEHTLLVVDEAQYIHKIGLNLKLIVDNIPGIKVIASGSSSFELAKDVGEPLNGRKHVLILYPLAQLEIAEVEKRHETEANLESRLIYGSYPEIVIMRDNSGRQDYLEEIVRSYLFKDILALGGIRFSNKLERLLQLLAFQIGKGVSYDELGSQLGMSKNTVERYLNLLQKSFVIYRLGGFSRNLRKEITKSPRYYFYDNGIRNAVIRNFNPIALCDDIGELWENYIITERIKYQEYLRNFSNFYFWRTYDKKEIDLVEEAEGSLSGYEIKWSKKSVKAPNDWIKHYPSSSFTVINPDNYLEFIMQRG